MLVFPLLRRHHFGLFCPFLDDLSTTSLSLFHHLVAYVVGLFVQEVHEATSDLAHSYEETSQAVMDGILTLQEYNLKLVQSLFSAWFGRGMEPRPLQKESTESLQQQWGQQTQKQQEAFQRPAAASMRMYTGILLAPFTFWAPFSFSRQPVDAAATELEREREWVLKRLAHGLQYAYGQESLSEETPR